jgi:hypothetical protein
VNISPFFGERILDSGPREIFNSFDRSKHALLRMPSDALTLLCDMISGRHGAVSVVNLYGAAELQLRALLVALHGRHLLL